jgi:hypothetical protein
MIDIGNDLVVNIFGVSLGDSMGCGGKSIVPVKRVAATQVCVI